MCQTILPNIRHVKIGANLSRNEVLTLEDVGFQLQHKKILSPRRMLSTIAMFPIPHTDFHVPLNLDAHSIFRFGKPLLHNLAAPMVDHKNKWESVGLMDGCYVVGITARGVHSLLYVAYTCVRDLYYWKVIYLVEKIIR